MMKPELNITFKINIPIVYNIAVLVLTLFLCVEVEELFSFSEVSKLFAKVTLQIHRLLKIDWRPLVIPRLDCNN